MLLSGASDNDTPILTSPIQSDVWPQRSNARDYVTAQCKQDPQTIKDHPCPTPPNDDYVHAMGAGCGLYAYKTIPDAAWDFPLFGIKSQPSATTSWLHMGALYAEVSLWGKVYEHGRGYRAQYARIESIFHIPSAGKLSKAKLQWIADGYGVPLVEMPPETMGLICDDIAHRQNAPPTWDDVKEAFEGIWQAFKNRLKRSSDG